MKCWDVPVQDDSVCGTLFRLETVIISWNKRKIKQSQMEFSVWIIYRKCCDLFFSKYRKCKYFNEIRLLTFNSKTDFKVLFLYQS